MHRVASPFLRVGCSNLSLRLFYSKRYTKQNIEELAKEKFSVWAKREGKVLAALVFVSLTASYFYQNRESAPVKRVHALIAHAEKSVHNGDRRQALRDCLEGFATIKDTNSQDRHLFGFAFSIATQFETLRNTKEAVKYYLEAMQFLEYLLDPMERIRSKLVVYDRIAQCYENLQEYRVAETYHRQAILHFEQRIQSNPEFIRSVKLVKEVPGVFYNFAYFLWQQNRHEEAEEYMKRAKQLAMDAKLSDDRIRDIDSSLAALSKERNKIKS